MLSRAHDKHVVSLRKQLIPGAVPAKLVGENERLVAPDPEGR
jgi:hypothetical protein